ncbi:60Kd inner membrane protein-domain-containing protein [Crepidotus variabilis]|uniref:60Kd inner membrane protein-domain-containing protein n=1 Tax=Crepidotus variabilis TaxID=179855 RepID=A0A9P6EHH9_9AGAR|nr:60Kd inner membrane protein-domain-containing protein [Crepidotus variabilis]
MSLASSVGLSFRCAGLRLPARGARHSALQPLKSNLRTFSSGLQSRHHLIPFRVPTNSRNLSLWSSTKPTSQSASSPITPPETLVDEARTMLTGEISESTSASSLSGTPVEASSEVTPVMPPDVDLALDSIAALDSSSLTDTVLQHAGQLQWGDLSALGLTGYTPAGLIRWSFEVINVTTQLPWFWTIVAGSAFWRLVCVPLTIAATRNAAKLAPHQEAIKALQEKMNKVSTKNPAEKMKIANELSVFYKKHDISPLGAMVGLAQLPITLGLFFAAKGLCDLPLEQLKDSGFAMFPDLTVTDPSLFLPIAMTLAVNTQLMIGARDVASNLKPMMYFFHFLTVPGFFLMKAFPAGLLVSMITTTLLTTIQTIALRIPALRAALKIPPHIPQKAVPGSSPFAQIRELLSQSKPEDVKAKVSQARREAAKVRPSVQTPRLK